MTARDSLAVVPIRRGDPQVRFSDDVQEFAFHLWMTLAGRNAAATERLLADEMPGEAIPTRQTIAAWAREGNWVARSEALWRTNGARTLYELQQLTASNFVLAQRIKLMAMTGAFAGREMEGALALKASEAADRLMERGVVPLVPAPPKSEDAIDWECMTTDEKSALAREIMQERKAGDRNR